MSKTPCSRPPRNPPSQLPPQKYSAFHSATHPGVPRPSTSFHSSQHNPIRPPAPLPELRKLARAPRKKSPGPDGVPPYLLASLPDALFGIVHKCLTLCSESGYIPDPWLISETFCIFKGKGQWQDPDRWRPIAMSKSIYRLLMRWVYHTLYPLIAPQLHPKQFGGRQGSSTAHATKAFLQELEHMADKEAVLAFGVYHAFDSPRKYLIHHTLLRMGAPAKLLLLISLVLARGATFLRGAEDVVLTTTHSVKEGSPLSCFLSVVVFDIPLRFLSRNGVTLSAHVDDILSPAPTRGSQTLAFLVQHAVSLISCQVNAVKSKSLPLSVRPPPTPPCPSTTTRRTPCRAMGLPLVVATKTLYTHRSHGLGLGHFPTQHPTRVWIHCTATHASTPAARRLVALCRPTGFSLTLCLNSVQPPPPPRHHLMSPGKALP